MIDMIPHDCSRRDKRPQLVAGIRRLVLPFGALVFLSSFLSLPLESQVRPAIVIFDGPQSCLSPDQIESLSYFVAEGVLPEGEQRRAPLDTVFLAYRCMLDARAELQTFSGFRSDFIEALHGAYEGRELCLLDRLTGALVTLRDVSNRGGSPRDPLPDRDVDRVYGALSDVRFSVQAAHAVQSRFGNDPEDPVVLRYMRTWCVEPVAPVPAEAYFRELIDASVSLAERDTRIGRDVGAVLASALPDAQAMFGWVEGRDPFRNESALLRDWSVLVSVDRGNLSSTRLFLEVVKDLEELEGLQSAVPDEISPESTLPRLEEMKRTLRIASDRLIGTSEAWKYYDHYSDVLFGLADVYASGREPEMFRLLINEAGRAAWEGFRRVAGLGTSLELSFAQKKLMDRVASYGAELAVQLDYSTLVDFESQFVDDTGRIVPEEFQCYAHAHLTQAYYVLGAESPDASREYLSHLDKSCGLLSQSDLDNLRQAVQGRIK